MERVAAGAHLPTPWLFEPAKRPDDKTNYCLNSFSLGPLNSGGAGLEIAFQCRNCDRCFDIQA